MIYTAIFLDKDGQYVYDLYDAPHGFKASWYAIDLNDERELVAVIPGNHQIGFRDNLEMQPSPFSQTRQSAAWSVR